MNAIRRATWDLAVTDAQYGLEGGLSQEGDLYELREFTIEESEQGPLGSFMVSNFDDDSWTHISCDLKSGEVTVSRESELLSGLAEDAELDAILVDLRSEPESGDSYKEHIAQLFNRTVVQTAGDPDCQEWATDYVSKSKNR
ncbi:MAG: hypothetical protein HIU81_11245 [Acidobacteria bacterium]|nr:hypothetical protein [Acidobacteriota bacterium]